jgi:hypothetical protein
MGEHTPRPISSKLAGSSGEADGSVRNYAPSINNARNKSPLCPKCTAPPKAKEGRKPSHTKNDGSFVSLVARTNHATIV